MAVQAPRTTKPPPSGGPATVAEPPRKPRLWRRICVAVLLILGAILTPIAVLVTYAKTEVLDTDRYVATVKPLASDPAIQNYVADTVSKELLSQIDVNAYVNDTLAALPPRAQGLAGPVTNAVESLVQQTTLRFVQSNAFQKIWVEGNKVAHKQMVRVLTNKGGNVTVQRNGAVQVDLRGVAGAVQKELVDSGLSVAEKIPLDKISGSITIFQSEDLYKARKGAQLLNTVGYALPFIAIGCLAGAVLLSARKRRGFIKAAIAFAIGAVVLAILVNGARHFYLNALPTSVPQDAAAAIYDTLLRSLHTSVRNILFVALVVVVAAYFSGPARPAVAFRDWWARTVPSAATGTEHGVLAANAWVGRNQRLLRIILAVVLFVVVFRWPHPTTAVILWLAVLGLVGLAVIDFYGRQPAVGASPTPGDSA